MKINILSAVKNLTKNLLLLFSTGAALCLLLPPSKTISLALIGLIFIAVCVAAIYDVAKPQKTQNQYAVLGAVLIALFIEYVGLHIFYTTFLPSGKVASLANSLKITVPILLNTVGLLGCVFGFYSLFVLGLWIINISSSLLTERRKDAVIANLKRNWLFPISAIAFFYLNSPFTDAYRFGMVIAFAISVVIASQIPSMFALAKKGSLALKLVAILSSAGICWASLGDFYTRWGYSPKHQQIISMLPPEIDISLIVSIIVAIASLGFAYLYVLLLLSEVKTILIDSQNTNKLKLGEVIIYSLLIVGSLVFMVVTFSASEAFYGTDIACDIIYTSDSPALVKRNIYTAIAHSENDLRQPLFAVFSAPFVGIACLIGKLLFVPAHIQAMLLNSVQVVMLFVANFMLAKTMKLTTIKRVCFMVLSSFTYTFLLFVLMMEQYIIAYFWLVLCIYMICEKKSNRLVLFGAGGTLLTSMVLLPATSEKSPFKNFKEWIGDMLKYGFEFIAVWLAFCRFEVIYYLTSTASALNSFTGKDVLLTDKIYQYTEFIGNCFLAPNAGANNTAFSHISWQLNQPTEMSIVGVSILILCIVSAWVNRKKKSTQIAICWVAFSIVILFGLGWGTKENGSILYALYFGWAFLVLLFQLVEKIAEKWNLRFLVPLVTAGCTVAFAVINIPAIIEMIRFAIQYYPL